MCEDYQISKHFRNKKRVGWKNKNTNINDVAARVYQYKDPDIKTKLKMEIVSLKIAPPPLSQKKRKMGNNVTEHESLFH